MSNLRNSIKPEIHVRLVLVAILADILEHGRSLSAILPNALMQVADPRDKSLVQFCAYGICRDFFRLDFIIKQLASRPIKDKNLYYLLMIGIFQLNTSRIPEFAVVNTVVNAAKKLKLFSASGFINGVLREYLRNKETINSRCENDPVAHYNHPLWLMKAFQGAYPEQWQTICEANNQLPPMWLRINTQQIDPEQYAAILKKHNISIQQQIGISICLQQPIDVSELPGFYEGWVSVQDISAQQAAHLLDVQPGHLVLDACAAPGGKTGHLLEQQPLLACVVAVEKENERTKKIHDNLQRLKLSANVITADASQPDTWWDKQLFDRILLDAPCSATGVIKRHPDSKLLRKPTDIPAFAVQQLALLNALWPLLKPDGKLLYVTCSILPEENQDVIATFCQQHPDARCTFTQQLLPTPEADGFFYALLDRLH